LSAITFGYLKKKKLKFWLVESFLKFKNVDCGLIQDFILVRHYEQVAKCNHIGKYWHWAYQDWLFKLTKTEKNSKFVTNKLHFCELKNLLNESDNFIYELVKIKAHY
jgi:hypothetical protein